MFDFPLAGEIKLGGEGAAAPSYGGVYVAGLEAIYSVGDSVATFLQHSYEQQDMPTQLASATFRVVSSGQLAEEGVNFEDTVTLYLYRVSLNEQLRNARLATAPDRPPPLSLNLHYLLTIWSSNPLREHTLLAWTMRQLNDHAILDMGSLDPDGEWTAEDVLHVIPAELTNEDLMRIWDALSPAYRLSQSYVVRAVRLDPLHRDETRAVVARSNRYRGRTGARDE